MAINKDKRQDDKGDNNEEDDQAARVGVGTDGGSVTVRS